MKKIIAPYDFSARSKSALRKAFALAKIHGSEVVVMHVVSITRFGRILKDLLDIDRVCKDVHEKISNMLVAMGEHDAKVVVKNGVASVKILECAKEEEATLIVLGDHGEFHLKDILLGSTAKNVIARSTVPVLVIKNDNEPRYSRVLASVDFSKSSILAYEKSCRMFPDAHFLIFHGYAVPSRMVVAEYGMVSDNVESALESIREEAKDRAKEITKKTGCNAEVMVRSTLSASEDILQIALEERVELIVLGAKNEGSIIPFILGSVTNSLLQHSFVDMLVWRSE